MTEDADMNGDGMDGCGNRYRHTLLSARTQHHVFLLWLLLIVVMVLVVACRVFALSSAANVGLNHMLARTNRVGVCSCSAVHLGVENHNADTGASHSNSHSHSKSNSNEKSNGEGHGHSNVSMSMSSTTLLNQSVSTGHNNVGLGERALGHGQRPEGDGDRGDARERGLFWCAFSARLMPGPLIQQQEHPDEVRI
jgi:hypothetical protein